MPSLLPDDFIPDVNTRLSFYNVLPAPKRKTNWKRSKLSLSIARPAAGSARTLLDVACLREQAQKLGIRKLEGNERRGDRICREASC
ncbi:TRCF domain-containing protein [Shigella flexneri]